MDGDATYFRRRAIDEQAAATKAYHPQARAAHEQMAERYAELAGAIESHDARVRSGNAAG